MAFDLDGTLLRGETVCECLARTVGRVAEMAAFERLASPSEIAVARRTMAQWYRPFGKSRLLAALDDLRFAPGAAEAFARLAAAGVRTAIVSVTWQFAVQWVAGRLGADHFVGTELTDAGQVVDFWPDDKARWLSDLLLQLGLRTSDLAAVGDSAGHIPMLRLAAAAYFVGRAPPPNLPVEHWPDADVAALVDALLARSGPVG